MKKYLITLGILLLFAWFVFKNFWDTIGIVSFLVLIFAVGMVIWLAIKRNPKWKQWAYGALSAFILFIVGITNAPVKPPAMAVANSTHVVEPTQVSKLVATPVVNKTANTPKQTNIITAKVTRVVDGDTFKVIINGKEETVRMLLVDTPETVKPNTPVQPFGKEASNFTKSMMTGKTVELERDISDARDKYGRLLYYVYVGGKSVQETLLEKGLARVAYVYPPNVKYVDRYRAIQVKAQKAKIGIWSIENYVDNNGFHAPVVKKTVTPKSTPKPEVYKVASEPKPQPKPLAKEEPKQSTSNVFYKNCAAVRSAGAAPIHAGEPGYSRKLDKDGDGVACE